MTQLIVLSLLLGQGAPKPAPVPPKPVITFQQGAFTITRGEQKDVVDLTPKEISPKYVAYRKNKTWAVWDKRGLTLRVDQQARSTKLGDLAVNPKVQSINDIRETLTLIKEGKRTKDATALSGSRRVGNFAYFLARWEDSASIPWLEVLVRVDLTMEKPNYQYVGKPDGLSSAKLSIDDKVSIQGTKLQWIARKEDTVGISKYDAKTKTFAFERFEADGEIIADSSQMMIFSQKTNYGTTIGGFVHKETGKKTIDVETSGTLKILDGNQPRIYRIEDGAGVRLHNAESGAELKISESAMVKRTPQGVLVWSVNEEGKPKQANLYESSRWRSLASWVSKAQ